MAGPWAHRRAILEFTVMTNGRRPFGVGRAPEGRSVLGGARRTGKGAVGGTVAGALTGPIQIRPGEDGHARCALALYLPCPWRGARTFARKGLPKEAMARRSEIGCSPLQPERK